MHSERDTLVEQNVFNRCHFAVLAEIIIKTCSEMTVSSINKNDGGQRSQKAEMQASGRWNR
jgi:hypothetical protein